MREPCAPEWAGHMRESIRGPTRPRIAGPHRNRPRTHCAGGFLLLELEKRRDLVNLSPGVAPSQEPVEVTSSHLVIVRRGSGSRESA